MTADVEHRQGCPATGGYGHGVEPCICGAATVVELPPLPEWPDEEGLTVHGHPFWKGSQLERYATDYARTCVEHNVRRRAAVDPLAVLARAQQAEARVEALRAEVEGLKQTITRVNESCIRWADDAVTQEDRAILSEARAERLAEAGRRVTAAFRAHGEASPFTRQAERTRHECEAAMLALDAALEQEEGK